MHQLIRSSDQDSSSAAGTVGAGMATALDDMFPQLRGLFRGYGGCGNGCPRSELSLATCKPASSQFLLERCELTGISHR